MNNEQSQNENPLPDADESRLAAVLRVVDAEAAAPDAEQLAATRERALAAFAQGSESGTVERKDETEQPRSRMISTAWRSLAAVAATVAAIWVGAQIISQNSVQGAPFSKVLESLRSANSLELRVTKDGHESKVWVRAPGLVRYEKSPAEYRIAQGSRLWKVDEKENMATPGDSPWFIGPDQQVDLLGLLEVGVKDAGPLLSAEPIEQADYANRKCHVYRADLPAHDGRLRIEAFSDIQTGELLGIIANSLDKPVRVGPPLAELRLVMMNPPVDESKFVVAKSLTDDGRIGKIADSQGLVLLRPALAQRWTPVGPAMLLKPGDWLRTEMRGANAVKTRLSSDAELTLGPGTLLEFISPTQARLHTGEVQVNLPKPAASEKKSANNLSFELMAPRSGSQKFASAGKQLVRVDRDEKLVAVDKSPRWLEGFEGTSSNESLGSLIVKLPDGRNEPLSVGYHKVSVEIRDQIPRTTIEESFVNRTGARLEGVFYFPLPADASISDFGMWIGNDLVEADVVEKQRAREIYETILREKKDPGLLEWTAGNLFKARVYPIEGWSEKRIKIVYTQVLPLRAIKYRYSYGLRSDLLRTTPLRELSLSVQVNSALPLKSVTCPTHSVRAQQTQHSAQLDFAAQEYTPNRDFEVVCEVENRTSDVVVIPHRRGENGYFLLQLTPPGREGNWQREVLPDGKPLELVLLCDTSASMDGEKRKHQAEFISTVLASLGEKDRFWLAAADVETVWASPEAMSANEENTAKALKFLEDRGSLGWTNLDKAFEAVLKKSSDGVQVIYVGDGIVTAGESDPNSFIKKLGRLLEPSPGADGIGRGQGDVSAEARSFHAVTVGNTYDATVLKGIAAVGHGSVRSISGDETPQVVAKELLNEIAQPGLRDLKVEFRGVKVAAVYPDSLPHVPAGTQQILVGRYLPTGKDQLGEVVVTGKLGSEAVRYAARIDLKDAEAGNSFIPRLWARAHLDHLLQQGTSNAIRDQIIALSEQFHIITPYTSLLVLESDADRERFGVKRRFEMRDGERFFAEGRDNANYELRQQQMKRAGDWRIGMRRQVLQNLAGLGRNSWMFQQHEQTVTRALLGANDFIKQGAGTLILNGENRFGGATWTSSGSVISATSGVRGPVDGEIDEDSAGFAGGGGGGQIYWDGNDKLSPEGHHSAETSEGLDLSDSPATRMPYGDQQLFDASGLSLGMEMQKSPARPDASPGFEMFDYKSEHSAKRFEKIEETLLGGDYSNSYATAIGNKPYSLDAGKPFGVISSNGGDLGLESGWATQSRRKDRYSSRDLLYTNQNYIAWLNTLFPALPAPLRDPSRRDAGGTKHKAPHGWSDEAVALSKNLMRLESLWKLDGGIELRRTAESFDPRWKRTTSKDTDLTLYAPTSWITRKHVNGQTLIDYCDEKERGVYSLALLLGRSRKAYPGDLKTPPFVLNDFSLSPLHEIYRELKTKIEPAGENQTLLILTAKRSKSEQRYLLDTKRHVLLKAESLDNSKVNSTTTFSDFVEVSGSWWARSVITTDAKGRKTSETRFEISSLDKDKYGNRLDAELAAKPQTQFLHLPGPTLDVARQHVADGSADFEDRITMILHNCLLQQWDEVLKQLDGAEKLAAGKPGVRWIRTVVLQTIRRNNEARLRMLDEARKLVASKQPEEMFLVDFIIGQSRGVASPAEQLEFVNILRPVYERQPDEAAAKIHLQEHLLVCYDALGRREDALALRGKLAEELPWDIGRQIDYANQLLRAGKPDAAYAWLQKQLDRDIEFDSGTDDSLRSAYAELYRTQTRWADLLKFTADWVGRNPEYQSAYTQHFSALIYNDKQDEANKLAETWLKESQSSDKLSPSQSARLESAISFAQGNVYGMPSNSESTDRWLEPLAETAKHFARQKEHFEITGRIVNSGRFFQTAVGDRFRGFALSLLQSKLDQLSPEQISGLVGWALSGRIELAEPIGSRKQMDASEIPSSVWKKIADQLRQRWATTEDDDEKNSFSQILVTIYGARFSDSELLPFLRERIEKGPAEFKLSYISALFDTIISRKWSEENEKGAFALLPKLTDSTEPADVLATEVPALYRLVDAMINGRQQSANEELRDKGKTDQLTRTQLLEKKTEFAKVARTAIAERLGREADASTPLAPWLRMEKAYLDVQLNQNFPQVEEFCWKVLGDAPAKPKEISEADAIEMTPEALSATLRTRFFAAALHSRSFVTVMNLAARRNAQPQTVSRVLKFIDSGIEQGGDAAASWRATKFQMLVALDRPDDLDRELRAWLRSEPSTAPWRRALAMLLAERGKLDEAIQIFEALEKDQLLTAIDYRTLSDWYLVTDRRADYEKARIESYKQMPEQVMNSMFWGLRNRWLRTDLPLPSKLDDNTLLAMRALFAKSSNPENYFWQLRELYAACRDFRLLDMLPDAVLGRSPQQIYGFLQGMRESVLGEVRNEATADEILARIKKLRESKLTNTDERALDLMEALVERRASEVLNQPKPHVDACLAAMKRAFARKSSDGEPILMAGFLRNLGTLPHQPLIDEQLAELRSLQAATKPTSRDHLIITDHLCNLMFSGYGKHEAAIEEMEVEVRTHEQAHDGHWPHADDAILGSYVGLLEGVKRHAAGEEILLKHLTHPENDDQRKWMNDRLLALYNSALESDAEVTLGKGNTLLENLIARGLKELDTAPDENVRYDVVARMVSTFDIARRKNLASGHKLLESFAFDSIPVVLKKQQSRYRDTATSPLNVVAETLGPKPALRYIVERMEQYPPRLEHDYDNRWQAFGYEMAKRREESANAKTDIVELEARMLKLIVTEIQRHIRTGRGNNQHIYYINWQYFWAAKADDFAQAAEEVYTQDNKSGRNVVAVANYLWNCLNRYDRAIEILLVAFRDGVLDEAGQNQLAQWLQNRNRHPESIPILEPLVELHPDSMHYRTMLMLAYHRAQRPQQLLDLVKSTDTYFHEGGRWTDGNVAEFGKTCGACGLNNDAVAYLTEAISLHQRANGQVVLGDAALSDWYQNLANAHSALGHTKDAVDAASGAIVCWSPRQDQRRDALNKLKDVLQNAKDLPEFVKHLDEQTNKTGEDSPILRKAIGEVFKDRNDPKSAIAQLKIAVQLEPNDKEIHQALIACYDASEDKAAGTRQLVALIELDSHNLPLYQQLAERFKDQPKEAERAVTSIIEAGPQESENHTALAAIRQKQDRWDEAITEWSEVAKLRSLEPTGLVKLGEAQLHQKQWDAARQTIEKLQRAEWPSRFGDVVNQTRQLQEKLPK